ncbi:hypothetical protein QR680_012690 [Steinernema hermaphroditum]|uniref:Uncharacterized protein n=1 Tax=Steinernema hermaphroditum TaxID=289476 RepID=A0AA39M0Y3_9BILA|nr:hypothetical protein QR680_012690 [Steinernema hermaphroditum]
MRRAPVVTNRSPKTARSRHDPVMASRKTFPSALLVSIIVVFALQPVVEALTVADLCRQGAADSAALCRLRALQRASQTPSDSIAYDGRLRPQRSGGGAPRDVEEVVKPEDAESWAPLRLAFWRFTRLHPREDRSSASVAAATSFSKNGGKRGYDFIRFGRSANGGAPLASYDFIRLGRK